VILEPLVRLGVITVYTAAGLRAGTKTTGSVDRAYIALQCVTIVVCRANLVLREALMCQNMYTVILYTVVYTVDSVH